MSVELVGCPECLALIIESNDENQAFLVDAVDMVSLFTEHSARERQFFSSAERAVCIENKVSSKLE